MGRYRPPAPPSSPHVTEPGYWRLKAELRELWSQRRPEVVTALTAAAAEGDRSENAEYTYRKKQLAEIDRRVRYLTKRLDSAVIVREAPSDPSAIYFGAWVVLDDSDIGSVQYRIVGADETDAARGWISIDSPLARALLKKRSGDDVCIESPAGRRSLSVTHVYYHEPDSP